MLRISEGILTGQSQYTKTARLKSEDMILETFQTGYAGSDKKLNRETMGTKQNIQHTILDGHGDRMEYHGEQIQLIGLQLDN